MKADARGNTSSLNEQPMLRGDDMSSFQNNAPVQNQAGPQVINGNVTFNNYGAQHRRSRIGYDGAASEQLLDDDILASLAFPQMSDRRRNVEPPHRESCQWLFDLDEYRTWKAKSHGLLWIKGLPGSGKSTLMSHLFSDLWCGQRASGGVRLEFFFSARGVPLQRTPLGMLRSLLNQIFYQDPASRSIVRKLYQEKCASFGSSEPAWQWQIPELKMALSNAISICAQHRQITIFVDALDEAGQQAARDTAHYLHNLNDLIGLQAGTARICISCRHYPVPSTARAVEVCMERHNQGDIEAYIKDYLHLGDLSLDLVDRQKEWLELSGYLVDTARGVFQWACLVVPMVGQWMSDGYSPQAIRKRLNLVPDELQDVYKHIIESVIDKHHRTQSLRLFQWTCLAMRPLSVSEMRCALAAPNLSTGQFTPLECHEEVELIMSSDVARSRIKSWSGGLIEVVDHAGVGIVQVIHQSVNDFLLGGGLKLLRDLDPRTQSMGGYRGADFLASASASASEPIQISHSTLYMSCLTYMSLDCIITDDIKSRYRKDNETGMNFARSRFPLLEYSTMYCLAHAQKASTYRSQDLSGESRLICKSLSAWQFAAYVFRNKHFDQDLSLIANCKDLLHIAAMAGLCDLVQYRIGCGDDFRSAGDHGWTALHFAAIQGHLDVIKALIDAGADPQQTTGAGKSPLVLAASGGFADLFSWLMIKGACVDTQHDVVGSPLYNAAAESCLAICRLCIDAGANVNAQGGTYGNALQAASFRDNEEIVRLLLEAGAHVNAQGGEYGSALQAAASRSSEEIVRLLLEAGAHVNAHGEKCGNALQAAASRGSREIVRLLLKAGADIHAQGGHYGSALQAAALGGCTATVRCLLEAGADVNTLGGYYGSALQAAALRGCTATVRCLLEAGADVNAHGGEEGTALRAATRYGDKEVVSMLLEAGADIHKRGRSCGSALDAALDRCNVGTIDVLIAARAKHFGLMQGNCDSEDSLAQTSKAKQRMTRPT